MNIKDLYTIFLQHGSVSTDTRTIRHGDIFFALKGGNYNGNEYTQVALEKGASLCIVDEDPKTPHPQILKVEDSLATLQQLANYHRKQFKIPFLAITGSNGKTTTKELIHAVLSTTLKTYITEGNLNNHIGIPITLLKIKADAEIAVIEMGANHIGEIAGYCNIAEPTHGLITNCGKAHLEGFGSEEGIRKGKGELFDFIRVHNGTAFINADLNYLVEMSAGIGYRIFYASRKENKEDTEHNTFLEVITEDGLLIKTHLVGNYNLPNVLAAIAVGKYFNVESDVVKSAIENYIPSNSRSQLLQWKTNTVIMDAYNANPSSMIAAITNFAQINSKNKILILGEMKELGQDSKKEHLALVQFIEKFKWSAVLLVGEEFSNLAPNFKHFNNSLQVAEWLKMHPVEHAHILLKGSRSVKMENVLDG